jgi:hypothetical protein
MAKEDTRFMGTFFSYKESPWKDFQWERLELVKKVSTLPIVDCLFVLSRIEHYLWRGNIIETEAQDRLVDLIFHESNLKQHLKQIAKQNVTIFHPQQIYFCMGILLRYGRVETIGTVDNNFVDLLGKILLQISGFCEQPEPRLIGNPSHQKKEMAGIVWQIGNIYSLYHLNLGTELARSNIIFSQGENGAEFAKTFKEATDIDLLKLWSITFSIFGRTSNSLKEFISSDEIIDKDKYFSTVLLDKVTIDKIINLISADIETLKQICGRNIGAFDNEYH